ncbi:NAD(P)/FAD-dependent oxidoreductase [Pseudalkalibacillus sp. A8]|uniref:NAD(P)/FAD-dependent oxidoreductase n=1 Tax=Pseudalkalibacillus sp. A8 TaxID=3382641 RepID=UPI0038B63545
MKTDVLIIGGGPAGLSAAIELGARDLHVTILDESNELGGQLHQQTQVLKRLPSTYRNLRGFELAEQLVNEVNQLSVHQLLGHRVIGLYEDGSVGISDDLNVFPVRAKKIIVSTGAYERAVPFLKWTLPGIMTIGAAQTLINRDMVLPGKETFIVGLSNFSLDVAEQLRSVGVHVKGILQPKGHEQKYCIGSLEAVRSMGIPIYKQAEVVEAKGNGKVEQLVFKYVNQLQSVQVDSVCIDGGRSPILDIFYQLNCSFGYQEVLGGWLPQYDSSFKTSNENVFLAGNASGISDHGALLLTGRLAAISVLEDLQKLDKQDTQTVRNLLWKEIETLESWDHPDVWTARREHIEQFLQPKIKDQFIS